MKLKAFGKSNCHVLVFSNGNEVLFSYETPVAVALANGVDDGERQYCGVYKTATKHSKTTTGHINSWTDTTKTLRDLELAYLIKLASR